MPFDQSEIVSSSSGLPVEAAGRKVERTSFGVCLSS